MFTGLVRTLGTVAEVRPDGFTVVADDADALRATLGASIAVDGCCLTVTSIQQDGRELLFDVMPHTLQHTAFADLAKGARVNLEPALAAGEPFGGHLVQGHVDAVGVVTAVEPDANATVVSIEAPPAITRYCIPRGSVTVAGVSLTVISCDEQGFRVSLIPETRERTTLGSAQVGTKYNLESDVIARYVEQLVGPHR